MSFPILERRDLAADRGRDPRDAARLRPRGAWEAPRARRVRAHVPRERAPLHELRRDDRRDAVRRDAAVDSPLRRDVLPGRRRHLDAADSAHDVLDANRRDRGLAGDQGQAGAVLRRLPDDGRPDDRRVRRARRAAVLCFLGSDARADVHHHRGLGRGAARLRDREVLPVYVPGLRVHAGRTHLYVPAGRQLLDPRIP